MKCSIYAGVMESKEKSCRYTLQAGPVFDSLDKAWSYYGFPGKPSDSFKVDTFYRNEWRFEDIGIIELDLNI